MSQTVAIIKRLEDLQQGERSRLRRLAGQPLDKTLQGFDLFTGLWWPLRATNERTPRRELSWLIAKLFGASSVPHVRPESGIGPSFPYVLGCCEPTDPPEYKARDRFRRRFDAVICSTLFDIEPRLDWALGEIAKAVAGRVPHVTKVTGIDWALLLDDLSLWDSEFNPDDTWQKSRLIGHKQLVYCHEMHRTPQDLWACEYLYATDHQPQGASHAD
ncbi:MAG: type I-E CRISPR-associated protein Cse2/CasB [Planctomycetaceae bacterium]